MLSNYIIFLITIYTCLITLNLDKGLSCYLQGTDSGYCSAETLDKQYRVAKMPYCMDYVKYPACLPKPQQIPPIKKFPRGRWFNHTVDTKDSWIALNTAMHVTKRESIEKNKTLIALGRNEYGEPGSVKIRFNDNRDCENAFKAFMCYANFPRCDLTTGLTLPVCKSACENFFISCGYEKNLWRCGKSKYFNGYEPESSSGSDVNGTPIYLRDFFPGQPFRQNKFDKDSLPVAVCTPSVFGRASSTYAIIDKYFLFLLLFITIILSSFISSLEDNKIK